ncbi:phage tail tape measure protein [Chengkuizengella sp. SCS-71B]|uniref:phage tail tape measure protein n=1 Tax=Chengkuizengella sp. SCS-71B TaxID=3115290 RepID=UPI0032C21B7B
MEEVGALKVNLGLDSAEFTKSITDINRKLKAVESEFKVASTSVDGFGSSVDDLKVISDNLSTKLQLQSEKVRTLRDKYEESVKTKGKEARETENLLIRYNKTVSAMNSTRKELDKVNAKIEDQTNTWKKLKKHMDEVSNSLKKAGSSLGSIGKDLSLKLTAPISAMATGIVVAGANFEEAMSKVKAISVATENDVLKLKNQAKELGSTTKFSATEAAEGMQFLSMAGFETQEILSSMPGLLDLAAAGALDLGAAADITSNIMSAFAIEASQTGHVSDVIAKAASSANTSVEQLGEAMVYLAPSAQSLGWSIEESTAAVMSLSDAGIQGQKAGAAFSTSLTRLAKPTGKMSGLMEVLSLNFFDTEGKMKPLPDLVGDLQNATHEMSEEQKAATLATIFGSEAYKHWAVLLEAGSNTLGKNTQMLINADGAARKMAETMSDNTKGGFKEFQSALEGLAITLSDYILPHINKVLESVTNMIRKFGEMDSGTQKLILVLGGIAAAIGPILVIIGTLVSSIGSILSVITPAISAIGGAGGFSAVLAAITGPIGIAVAAIAGLIAIFVTLYKKNETFRDGVKKIWDRIKSAFSTALGFISYIVRQVMGAVTGFFNEQLEKIKGFWDENGESIMEIVNVFTTYISEAIEVAMSYIQAVFQTVWPIIKGIVEIAWEGIKLTINNVTDIIMGIIQTFIKLFQGDWEGAWETVKETFWNVWDNINEYFSGLGDTLFEMGKDAIQGFIDGIGGLKDKVIEKAKELAETLPNWVKDLLGINSPSRVMRELGEWAGKGFVDGIGNTQEDIEDQGELLSKAIIPDILGPVKITEKNLKKLESIVEGSAEDRYKNIKKWVDQEVKLEQLTLTEEAAIWSEATRLFKEGTDERILAEQNVFDVRKEIYSKLNTASEAFLKQTQEINTNIEEEEQRLNEVYEKAVKERSKSIYDFKGLFEEVVTTADITGKELIKNLEGQVNHLETWSDNIGQLVKRGIDEGLLEELRQMGPNAAPEIAALLNLTNEELVKYEALWKEKSSLARKQAHAELSGLRSDTELQIQQLHYTSSQQLEGVRNEFALKVKEIRGGTNTTFAGLREDTALNLQQLNVKTSEQLSHLKGEFATKTQEIRNQTKTEFVVLKDQLPDAGRDAMRGLIEGMNAMKSSVMRTAREIARSVKNEIQDALDINSPSRVMMDVGKWIPIGLAEGMERNMNAVIGATNNMAQATIPRGPNFGQSQQISNATNKNFSTNVTNHFHMPVDSPAQVARKQQQSLRQLALEWG